MADTTNIEWCDATFNPWIGCTKISTAATGGGGCDNCYAAAQDKFRRWTPEGWGGPRKRTSPANWRKPVQWNDQPFVECANCGWRSEPVHGEVCGECGQLKLRPARRRVFCSSLADVFDNQVPPEWRADLFRLIANTPNLDWLLLTKRIGNAAGMIAEAQGDRAPISKWAAWPFPNVWLGATVVNQEEADRDIPKLLATPARVRFLSMEPLLGPVDLQRPCTARCPNRSCWSAAGHLNERLVRDSESGGFVLECICSRLNGLHWVIVGGESGPGARPMHPDWARSIRDQCAAAGVPFLFKQWGEWLPWAQFCDAGVDDPPEQTKFQTRELVDGEWRDVGRPGYWEVLDGHVDDDQCVGRVGKKAAGRLLDGVEHNGFPEVR